MYLAVDNCELKSFFMNLGSGIIGAGINYVIFDQIIKHREKRDSHKKMVIAVKQANYIIMEYGSLLLKIYKASILTKPSKQMNSYKELFTDDFHDEIRSFDINTKAPVHCGYLKINGSNVELSISWLQYLHSEFSKLDSKLDAVIMKFSHFFEESQQNSLIAINSIRPLEAITEYQQAVQYAIQLSQMHATLINPPTFHDTSGSIIKNLAESICNYEKSISEVIMDAPLSVVSLWWSENVSPLFGESRLKQQNGAPPL